MSNNGIMRDKKEYKIVLKGKVARLLLRKGYTIVDVKPMKENKDMSVFVFKNEEGLEDIILKNR